MLYFHKLAVVSDFLDFLITVQGSTRMLSTPSSTPSPSTSYVFLGEVEHTPSKRCFDILFALILLVGCLPLLLLIATLILCTGLRAGLMSIVYADVRIGRGGRPFRCYKFRTMHVDAKERLAALLESNPESASQWAACRKLQHDPRITFIGTFLRRSSLDELPQLWNVLRGEMSFVGPRPVTEEELLVLYQEKADKILRVRPGLTGLWQVSGRSKTSYQTRIALDEQYIDQRSWLLDSKILVSTIPAVLFVRGAY